MEINYEVNLKRWRNFLLTLKPSKPYRRKQINEFPGHIDCLCTILGKRLINTQETDMPVKMKKTHASALKEKIAEASKKMSSIGNEGQSRSEKRKIIVKSGDENVIDLTMDDSDEDYDKEEEKGDEIWTEAKVEKEDMSNLMKLRAKEKKMKELEKSQAESEKINVGMDEVDNKFVDVKKITHITDFEEKTMKNSEKSHMVGENNHVSNMTNQDELDNKCIDAAQITDFKEKDNTKLPSRHYKIDEEKKSSSIASKQYETDKNRNVQTYDICNIVEANQNEDNDFMEKRGHLRENEEELIMENKFGDTITTHTTNLSIQNIKEGRSKWEEDEVNSNKRDEINNVSVVISSSEDTYVTDLSESEELILKCKNGGTVTKNIFSIQNVREPKNKWEEDEKDSNKLDGIKSANVVKSTPEDKYLTDLSESEEELLLSKYGDTFCKPTANFSNQNIGERRNKRQEDETKSNKNDEVGDVNAVVSMPEDTYKTNFSESEEELIIDNKYRDILTKHASSFSIQNDRERRKRIPLKSKSDVNKSTSQWNLTLFAKYVAFESVKPLEYSCEFKDVDNRVYDEIGTNVQKLRKVIDVHSEEDSRIIVNAMVIPLCEEFNLRLETEQTTDCTYLPNCKFDYRLLNHNTVIGCIETKSQSAMNEKALVQAILQLFVIQAEGLNGLKSKESIVEKSFFNILTDGIRFVFMRINGKHLELEYTNVGQLRVQYANSESEIKTISRAMVSLLMDNLSQT